MKFTSPSNTLVYDLNAKLILPEEGLYEGGIPKVFSDYIQAEQRNTEEFLFSANIIERQAADFLYKHIYSKVEKESIFLNESYFQNGIVGISNASQYYFNKQVDELSELELIFLLHKNVHNEESVNVLDDLTSFLDELQYKGIINSKSVTQYNKDLPELLASTYNNWTFSQSFVQHLIKELKDLGYKEEEFFRKGYSLHTYYNSTFQKEIFESFLDERNFTEDLSPIQIEGAMVIIDKRTGALHALMGGREFQHSNFNRATETTRQPASAFKPLIVFAPALERGWGPDSMLVDRPIQVGEFTPRNYDYEFRGELSLQEAFIKSYNVPTVWLHHQIGLEAGMDFVENFNLFDLTEEDGFKNSVGFTSKGTSPLALAQAYTIFSNDGKMVSVRGIDRIYHPIGLKIYENKIHEERFLEKETAETMTELLVDVVENGTGKTAKIEGQTIAAKTGTTSYDGWFVGYNDEYLSAIWIGPDEVEPENRFHPGVYPSKIFHSVFSGIYQ
ncbi:transglycosylase domain-containing protein [Sutcliffiella horikoshii]